MPRVARSPFLSRMLKAWNRLRPDILYMPGEALFGRAGITRPYQRLIKVRMTSLLLSAKAERARASVAACAQPTWRPSTRMLRKFHLVRSPEEPIHAHIEFVCNFSEPINVERS